MLRRLNAKWAEMDGCFSHINMRDVQWLRNEYGVSSELRWEGDSFPFELEALEFPESLDRLLDICERLADVNREMMRDGLEELYIVAIAGFRLGQRAAKEIECQSSS